MPRADAMELLTLRPASEYTGLTVATLRRYRMDNVGPASFILNGKVVYRRADLDKWLADQRAATLRGGRATTHCAAAS